jgi:oxalate---CoA ligase
MSVEDTMLSVVSGGVDQSTIGRQIQRQSEIRPDQTAIAFTGSAPLSYRELQSLIDEVRTDLRVGGFSRSARIAIASTSGPHAALAIIAVACSAVAIPLNPKHTLDEIERCFAILRPDAVILLRDSDSAARRAAERNNLAIIEGIPAKQGSLGLKLDMPQARKAAPATEPDPEAPAFILQTSGTTSEPKSIPFSHRNMLAAAARLQAWFKLTPHDRCLTVSPIYYSHGLKVTVFTPLLTGGTVAFPADPSKFSYSEWFETLGPSWYSAGPTLHRLIFDQTQSRADAKTMHALRFVLSGGAPLPRDIREGLQQVLGIPVVEHYGSSEAAQISANLLPPDRSKPGTSGTPWPETVMIVGESGRQLVPGERGEILVRGPTVMSGYLDAPELNRASFVDGWLKTGDIGSLDEEGFLTLHGRQKDLINRGGEKIWPIEIDEALMRHPAVAEAAAFAVPHPRLGEDVAAAVVLNPAMTASTIDLRAYLTDQLASFKIPRRIIVVDQLPKGLTGKVLRRRLGESLATAAPSVAPNTSDSSSLSTQLIGLWERLLKSAPINIDDDFFDKGGDSLLAVELLSELERLTGRTVPSSMLFEAATIRQLTQRLSEEDNLQPNRLVQLFAAGSQEPLIFFHGDPSGGSYVKRLATLLGSNQPIFVVSPHGLDNEPVPSSLEAMAADRLPLIIDAQPQGPYRLCGYCVGGLVAFETARLLVAAGKTVDMVVMIDPPTANARRPVQALFSMLDRVRLVGGSVAELGIARIWYQMTRLERFSNLSLSQQLGRTTAKARAFIASGKGRSFRTLRADQSGFLDKSNESVPVQAPFGPHFSNYFWKYSVAMSRYHPTPLAVRVIYFSAEFDGEAWRRISPDLETIKLPGGHLGVPTDPSDMVAHLRPRLRRKTIQAET